VVEGKEVSCNTAVIEVRSTYMKVIAISHNKSMSTLCSQDYCHGLERRGAGHVATQRDRWRHEQHAEDGEGQPSRSPPPQNADMGALCRDMVSKICSRSLGGRARSYEGCVGCASASDEERKGKEVTCNAAVIEVRST
jgi:hypothetical protein